MSMSLKFKDLGWILKTAFNSWIDKNPFGQSAAIAYYSIFSLPALLVIVTALSGILWKEATLTDQIFSQMSQVMGVETADQIKEIVVRASKSERSVRATIFGVLILIFGATGVFVEMQRSLNNVWGIKIAATKGNKILALLRTRVFSFGLIFSIGFLLFVSLIADSILASISGFLRDYWDQGVVFVFYVINFVLSILMLSVLFALMFKFLPDAKIKWKSVWMGAIVTSLLFAIGKIIVGYYFGKAQPESVYGAAGSIVLVLLWASYTSMIVFFGAEFSKATSDLYYGDVKPGKFGVKVETRVVGEKHES